jgi:hypothetical protein
MRPVNPDSGTEPRSKFVFGLLIGSGVSASYFAFASFGRADLVLAVAALKLISAFVLLIIPRWRLVAAGVLLSSVVGVLILFHIVCSGPIP